MTYEIADLAEIEFPMYFSIFAKPGLDINKLREFCLESEHLLFSGLRRSENDTTHLEWSSNNWSIEGITIPHIIQDILFLFHPDIWNGSKFNISEVFIGSWITTDLKSGVQVIRYHNSEFIYSF